MDEYSDNCKMDLLGRRSALIIWGPPIVLVIAASALINGNPIPRAIGAPLLTLGSFWMGIACFINGRRCSRTHCTIDGIAMPVLGTLGILEVLNVLNFPLEYITGAFWLTLLVSYIPEWLGLKYIERRNSTTH